MFEPPRCPWRACSAHSNPGPDFCERWGSYHPKCRPAPVPRFRCKLCGRTFSRQTFRHSYHDHKPYLNAVVFDRFSAGAGIRETARRLKITRRNLTAKLHKISRTVTRLHHNRMGAFGGAARFQLDELETFEHGRAQPLTVPILIESKSMFIVDAAAARIRFRGKKTPRRQQEITRADRRRGRRRDRTRAGLSRVLETLRPYVAHLPVVPFRTDQKSCYGPLFRQVFGGERIAHEQFSSKLPRTRHNPLARINLTAAMARDLNGRLRRRSWLVSKRRVWLVRQLALFVVYRNYIRVRFADDDPALTPAMRLGFATRPLTFEQCLSWRQDWGALSIDVESGMARQQVA